MWHYPLSGLVAILVIKAIGQNILLCQCSIVIECWVHICSPVFKIYCTNQKILNVATNGAYDYRLYYTDTRFYVSPSGEGFYWMVYSESIVTHLHCIKVLKLILMRTGDNWQAQNPMLSPRRQYTATNNSTCHLGESRQRDGVKTTFLATNADINVHSQIHEPLSTSGHVTWNLMGQYC